MTATFSTTQLVDNRVVVQGTDQFGSQGRTIVDGTQWAEVTGNNDYDQAVEAFESAVEQFFAPLMEATVKLEQSLERPTDSLGYVVLQEKVEATAGQEQVLVHLTKDSQILRLIDQGDFARLMWVGEDLEILETLPGSNTDTVNTVLEDLGATPVEPDGGTPAE